MGSTSKRLIALLWKSVLLRRRHYIITALDLAAPLFLFYWGYSFLIYTYQNQPTIKDIEQTIINQMGYSSNCVYSPTNNITDTIMNMLHSSAGHGTEIRGIKDEKELERLLDGRAEENYGLWRIGYAHVAVVFLKVNATGKTAQYKLMPTTGEIQTINKDYGQKDKRKNPYGPPSDILGLQVHLNQAFINMTGLTVWNGTKRIGSMNHIINSKSVRSFSLLYFCISLAYIFLIISIIRDVIQEKCTGIKEYMKLIGLSPWMIWTQWLIYALLVHLPVTLGATVIFTMLRPILIPVNPFIIWLLFFNFTFVCVLVMFVLSCLFNSPNLATTITLFLWVGVHIANAIYLVNPSNFGLTAQILICLLPINNLMWAIETIYSFEVSGSSWKISNLFVIGESGSHISIGLSIVISTVECLLLIVILVFLDGIMPGKYGVGKPITFMCRWFLKKDTQQIDSEATPLPKRYERRSIGANVGIRIRGLKKVFGIIKKITAVNNVDLDIYEGEIMALLGHNGAGKTTTMSMLTGMTPPTDGVIFYGGKNISTDTSYRDSLGLCTQHNLYFPSLTAIEHLVFFGLIRGMTYSEAKTRGKDMLSLLNIRDKSDSLVKTLSGGMQRRLCLAISLVGDPKVLILDEPTSGLDPQNRRQIWDIILGLRGQRTILLTTHFMEEADVLGDRIAIMDHGYVICCGTTMFLKRLYGTGYQIHLLTETNSPKEDICNLIKMYVPNVQIISTSSTQLNINASENDVKSFPGLFEALERKKNALAIKSISVTCTTMEDVFLNVASKLTNEDEVIKASSKVKINSSPSRIAIQNMDGLALLCQRWKVLLLKYLYFRFKEKISLILIFIIPCWIIYKTLDYTTPEETLLTTQPPLSMSLNVYINSYNILIHDDEGKELAETVQTMIKGHGSEVDVLPFNTDIEQYMKTLSDSDFEKFSRLLLFVNITKDNFVILFRDRYHIPPIVINLMTNAVLTHSAPNENGGIDVIVHPYVPKLPKCDKNDTLTISMLWVIYFTFIYSWILATFTSLVTDERVNGFKQQQYLAGVSPIVYWLFNFSYDFCLYLFLVLLHIIIIVIVVGLKVLNYEWFYFLLLALLLLGLSGIFFVYLYSFLIDSTTLSYNMFVICGTFFTFIPVYWTATMKSFGLYIVVTCIICLLNPLYSFMRCIYSLSQIISDTFLCNVCKENCENVSKPLMKMITEDDNFGILIYILFLASTWICYLGTILLIDYKLCVTVFSKILNKQSNDSKPTDTDVNDEIQQLEVLKESDDSTIPLRVEWLGKTYCFGPKAVKNVSFILHRGECFGLLGVNGAGKTTTFKMLIGECYPNCGDAVIRGTSVVKNTRKYQTQVGYCPQFDAFPEHLTGEQVLTIVAQLRGIPKTSAKEHVYKWLDLMGITEHAKKKGGTYSGGTKRKLSTAMAFIGNPAVVFLDEPTTGVDPAARRKLWTVMQACQKEGQAIVLTSHSMEECEALCDRLTIMQKGMMMCLGTPEYLKNKFSQGYTVLVKLNSPTDDTVKLFKQDFQDYFNDVVIKDEHHGLINYQVTNPQQPLSRLFAVMLELKKNHRIVEDFSISNTTLEQLFMSFAKQ